MTASAFSGAGRYSIYTGHATNWPMIAFSAVLLLPLFVLGGESNGSWWDLAVPILISVAGVVLYALTGSSVRTAAGPQGVSIHFGLLGWPRCTYRLDQIEQAEVINLHPWYVVGFWWTPRRTCCTVSSGPTLRLLLRNGRTVTVTTPHPPRGRRRHQRSENRLAQSLSSGPSGSTAGGWTLLEAGRPVGRQNI